MSLIMDSTYVAKVTLSKRAADSLALASAFGKENGANNNRNNNNNNNNN